jgi:flagellar biosynthetic protein FliQ
MTTALLVDGLWTTLWLLAPFTVVVMAVAILVSLLQAIFQANDAGVVFFPKLAASLVLLFVAGPFLAVKLTDFGARALGAIGGG